MRRDNKIILASFGVLLLLVGFGVSRVMCINAWLRYGVVVEQCPDGDVHVGLTVSANDLRRGVPGLVNASGALLYAVEHRTDVKSTPIDVDDLEVSFARTDEVGEVEKADAWKTLEVDRTDIDDTGHPRLGRITLPIDLKDGDYTLRVKARSRAGDVAVDAPLPVFAPARVHLLTDRPLYEPGHTVKFRAVLLRARDLVPLDGRPGKWTVIDPQNTVVLEERAAAGDFGVVDGELPLDPSSPTGTWHVRYQSGDAVDDVAIEVKPFELPRFTVEVSAARPFYRAKQEPRLRVKVASAAGTPVSAALDLTWSVDGAWQPPSEWLSALPSSARTDRSGNFEIALPAVPADLVGKARISATVRATDGTGDLETGVGTVLMAQDAIDVDIVTELPRSDGTPGLVAGVNNRAYVRATTAAGSPLAGVTLTVKRAWERSDKGIVTTTDEDGVAALQIDPGPAVNVVVPALPVRLPPPLPPVVRTGLNELLRGDAPLADVVVIDTWNPVVARCGRFVDDAATVTVHLMVEQSGNVSRASSVDDAGACIAAQLRGRSLPAGGQRLFQLSWQLRPSLAKLNVDDIGRETLPATLSTSLGRTLRDARDCLGRFTQSVTLPRLLLWEIDGDRFSARFAPDPRRGSPLDDGRASCVEQKLASWAVSAPKLPVSIPAGAVDSVSFGALRFSVDPVVDPRAAGRVGPTVMLGYELLIAARAEDEVVGDTRLRVVPGDVPALRLRPSKVIADAGDDVTIEFLRGPSFEGELPEKLWLNHVNGSIEGVVNKEKRTVAYKLPADRDGWYEARYDGASSPSTPARIFVPRARALRVEVKPDQASYRPGQMAKLAITTREQDKGIKAAVGLIGVDATLAQLVPLPGPDAMDRLEPTVVMTRSAFNVFDATALALGRIRGKNAAAATVLLVSQVPTPVEIDVYTSANGSTVFDPLSPLTDRFFTALEDLYTEVRKFEAEAKPDEKLTPQLMLTLWDRALDAAKARGAVVTDAFGRRISLRLLPNELVALTDPRLVVADATRLPEDVEDWVRFAKRSPQ
ncbi:MAG: MG2 domain-containing protein [Deltaproteobacteria bacterium]|nr:MG2 domain-containing protein [Deltaproteobacteria bacterium]